MVLRTLFHPGGSPSVRKLHQSTGLRLVFKCEKDRGAFRRLFAKAIESQTGRHRDHLIAVFERPEAAEESHRQLVKAGVPDNTISILWRAGQFIRSDHKAPTGHSKTSVIAASAGGGLAGAAFGMSLLMVPGLGLMAVGGAAASQALATIGAVGGAFGATGGAVARMLTDWDVSDREVPYYEMAISEGKVFVAVQVGSASIPAETVREILSENGGTLTSK